MLVKVKVKAEMEESTWRDAGEPNWVIQVPDKNDGPRNVKTNTPAYKNLSDTIDCGDEVDSITAFPVGEPQYAQVVKFDDQRCFGIASSFYTIVYVKAGDRAKAAKAIDDAIYMAAMKIVAEGWADPAPLIERHGETYGK